MGLVMVLNKSMEDILPLVNANQELGLRIIHQPEVDGKTSLWPWGLQHEASETYAWFEGFYLHFWGTNLGKSKNVLDALRKLGVYVTDSF